MTQEAYNNYELTPEEKAQIDPHIQKWIDNARRTDQMTPEGFEKTKNALNELYAKHGVAPVPDEFCIQAPSVIAGRITCGLLACAFFLVSEKTKGWDLDRVRQVLKVATNLPLLSERERAKPEYLSRWDVVPYDIRGAIEACGFGAHSRLALECIRETHNLWHGGNQSCAAEAYVSFMREVVKAEERFGVDFSSWVPYETAGLNGGPRFLHDNFMVICDFPCVYEINDRRNLSSRTGPAARWRDGVEYYNVNGIRLPAWIIAAPERLDAKAIDAESNAEIRRVMMEQYGFDRYLNESGAKVVHEDVDGLGFPRRLLRKEVRDDEPIVMIEVTNSTAEPDGTHKKYMMRVDPNAYGGRAGTECGAAVASTWRSKEPGAPLFFEKPEDYILTEET